MSILEDDRVLGWVEAVLSSGRQVDLDALVSSIGRSADGLSPELARLEYLALASRRREAGPEGAVRSLEKPRAAPAAAPLGARPAPRPDNAPARVDSEKPRATPAAGSVRPAAPLGAGAPRPDKAPAPARADIPALPAKAGGQTHAWRTGIDAALAAFSLNLDFEIDAAPPISVWNEDYPMMPFLVGDLAGYVQKEGRFLLRIGEQAIVNQVGDLPRRYRIEAVAARDNRLKITVNDVVVFDAALPVKSKNRSLGIGLGFQKRLFAGRFHEARLSATTMSGAVHAFPQEDTASAKKPAG